MLNYSDKKLSKFPFFNFLFIGVILGLASLFRYQVGAMIAGMILWLLFIKKEKIRYLTSLVTGILIVIFLGVIIDYWFYGNWTFTPWNYFDHNILQGKAADFGVSPWSFYIDKIILVGNFENTF